MKLSEIPLKTPFACSCVKEMWLLLQLLIDKLTEYETNLNSFWFYFNEMLRFVQEGKSKSI